MAPPNLKVCAELLASRRALQAATVAAAALVSPPLLAAHRSPHHIWDL
jgi:hypothetical protein